MYTLLGIWNSMEFSLNLCRVRIEFRLSSYWVHVEFRSSSHWVRVEFSLRCICVKTQDHVILQHAEYQTQSSRYSFPPFYKFKAVFFLAFDFLQYYNTSVKKFYQSCNSVKLTSLSFLSWQVRDWHTKNILFSQFLGSNLCPEGRCSKDRLSSRTFQSSRRGKCPLA